MRCRGCNSEILFVRCPASGRWLGVDLNAAIKNDTIEQWATPLAMLDTWTPNLDALTETIRDEINVHNHRA